MIIRTLAASAVLALSTVAASAQGGPNEALQIAISQNACGGGATVQSAEFIDATTIRVTCLRPAGGDLGGSLGPTGLTVAGLTFVAIISTLGGDGDGPSGTNGT